MILKELKAIIIACSFTVGFFLMLLAVVLLFNALSYFPVIIVIMILLLFAIFYEYGIMFIITFYYHMKDFKKCKLLLKILVPQLLVISIRPYYYLYNSLLCDPENDNSRAENNCRKALEYGIKNTTDYSLAHAFLAEILLNKNEVDEAKKYLELAIKTPHRQELNELISKIKAKFPS